MRTKTYVLIFLILFIAAVTGASGVLAASGDTRWQYDTGGAAPSSPAIGTDGTIYVGSGTSLHAITANGSRKSGQWPYETGGDVISSPAIGPDGTIYVGSGDGYLHAVTREGRAKSGGNWPYKAGDSYVLSSPAIGADGTIYIISGDGYLHAVMPDGTSKEGWPCETRETSISPSYASPSIGPYGTVYVGSGTSLYAVNTSGSIVWTYPAGGAISASPTIRPDGVIYLGSQEPETGQLHAINSFDGSSIGGNWPYQAEAGITSSVAIGADGTIYVGIGASLHAISPDGAASEGEWPYPTGGTITQSTPAIGADGTIYVESDDNYLHAVNPDGTLKWKTETPLCASSSPAIGTDGTIYVGNNAVEGDASWTYAEYLSDMQAYADSYWPRFGQNSFNSHRKPAFALEMPDDIAAHPGSTEVAVPITLANLFAEGIRSVNMTIRYKDALEVTSVASAGELLESGYTFTSQIDDSLGKVVISVTADTEVYATESGLIAELRVNVLSEEQNPYSESLTFSEAEINDLSVSFANGTVNVVPQYILSGNVAYFKNGEPVSNVTLKLVNDTETYSEEATSDAQGNYVFADVPPGNYTLTPAKTDDLLGISALDAANILRYAEAKLDPDCHQMIAADVNMDKGITAENAAETAICSGNRDLGAEYWMNTGRVNWAFVTAPIETCEDWPPISYPSEAFPAVRTYLSLDSDKTDADFTAILLGDVTGNWADENPESSGKRTSVSKEVKASTEVNVAVNSSLTLPIALDQETAILGTDVVFQFDSSVMEMTGVTLTEGLLADWEANLQVIENGEGLVALKIYGSDEITGKGNLAFIRFNVTGSLDSSATLSLTKLECNETDASGGFATNDILAETVTVSVKYGPGDVDHSGAVDMKDLLLALKVAAGISTDAVYADADATGDGKIGMDDVLYILKTIGA